MPWNVTTIAWPYADHIRHRWIVDVARAAKLEVSAGEIVGAFGDERMIDRVRGKHHPPARRQGRSAWRECIDVGGPHAERIVIEWGDHITVDIRRVMHCAARHSLADQEVRERHG